jgi:hypothetical protein
MFKVGVHPTNIKAKMKSEGKDPEELGVIL